MWRWKFMPSRNRLSAKKTIEWTQAIKNKKNLKHQLLPVHQAHHHHHHPRHRFEDEGPPHHLHLHLGPPPPPPPRNPKTTAISSSSSSTLPRGGLLRTTAGGGIPETSSNHQVNRKFKSFPTRISPLGTSESRKLFLNFTEVLVSFEIFLKTEQIRRTQKIFFDHF